MTESAESAESANVLACRCSILWHDSEAVLSLIWVGIASKNEYSLIEDGKPDSNPSAALTSAALTSPCFTYTLDRKQNYSRD